jgi:hypothetical protein
MALWEEADVVAMMAKITPDSAASDVELCIRPIQPDAVVWTPENCELVPVGEARRYRSKKNPRS